MYWLYIKSVSEFQNKKFVKYNLFLKMICLKEPNKDNPILNPYEIRYDFQPSYSNGVMNRKYIRFVLKYCNSYSDRPGPRPRPKFKTQPKFAQNQYNRKWAMKVTIFQIFLLRRAILVKKCASGLIMNTNLKNLHH